MNNDMNLKSNKKIMTITKFDNVQIKNTHNGYLYPPQNILEIDSDDGYRIIDLFSQKDITDIDYFEIVTTSRTKKKVLFQERDD